MRRLAAHHPDHQIAAILNQQGRRTGTGLPFTEARVRCLRQQAAIPAAPPPDPGGELVSIAQAADPARRRDRHDPALAADGLLPAEQTTPHAPWRIRLTDEVRARFVPDVPDGFVPLDQAARASASPARPCCTRSNAANSAPSKSPKAAAKGSGFRYPAPALDCLTNDRRRGGQCEPGPGGPSRTTFSRACRKSSWPRCSTTWRLTERWKVKSNSSSVLRAGKRAALMRLSPPWLSRWRRPRLRAGPRRSAHSSIAPRAHARRASASARAAAGALSARNRCASSTAALMPGSTRRSARAAGARRRPRGRGGARRAAARARPGGRGR